MYLLRIYPRLSITKLKFSLLHIYDCNSIVITSRSSLGLYVQSIVSLTKWLVEDLLGHTVLTKSTAPIFVAEKLKGTAKSYLNFFGEKLVVFLRVIHLQF